MPLSLWLRGFFIGDLIVDSETKAAVMKMSVAGAGASLYGLTLNEWMALITIIYVILQIGLLVPKYWEMIFGKDK